jgi:WD40 repeat protein
MHRATDGSISHAFDSTGDWIRRIAVSRDGGFAATAHGNAGDHEPDPQSDNSVRIWDLKSLKLKSRFGGFGHSVFGIAFTADSRFLVGASLDGTIAIWETASGKELLRHSSGQMIYDLALSADGRFAATGDTRGIVTWWKLPVVE